MRLFLIRHGESVDNVARVYGGSRDSPLTWHGVLQSQCLAAHLSQKTALQHIFSSNLQRAAKTAESIVEEQRRLHRYEGSLQQLACLREKDFGCREGVRWDSVSSRRPDDSETRESMEERMREFVDQHLVPLLSMESDGLSLTCAVVAHGQILKVLYGFLMKRRKQSLLESPSTSTSAARNAEGPWRATIWWNASITECIMSAPSAAANSLCSPRPWAFRVITQNSTSHLRNVKKARGGIGSAAYDQRQRTMTSYFPLISSKRQPDGQDGSSSSSS